MRVKSHVATRFIGPYDDGVTFGQHRMLLVWNRLILPGGRAIVLERQPGAGASPDPVRLIVPKLDRLMATDRDFAKARPEQL